MKVYLAEFRYKDLPQFVWYKLGYVLEYDAALRFAGEEYDPFDVKILSSIYISNPDYHKAVELCKEVEGYLLRKFPKNFVLEEYLKLPRGTFDSLSGITEMFLLPKDVTRKNLIDFFNRVKDRVKANPKFNTKHMDI